MDGLRTETVEERLERLERANRTLNGQCRRWRRAGTVVLAGVGLLFLAGANRLPGTVEAGHFILRDEDGRMRAALAIRPDGSPGLGFFDATGQARLSIDLGPTGVAGISLLNGSGRPQAALAIRPDGSPGLGLFDPAGRPRLSLDIDPSGRPGTNLYGDDGTLRAALAIRPDGSPGLGFFDATGLPTISMEEPPGAPARPAPAFH